MHMVYYCYLFASGKDISLTGGVHDDIFCSSF